MFIAQEWPVAIAIGGKNRIEAVLPGPAARLRDIGLAHRLRIDRDELIDAPERDHFGTQRPQEFAYQIASDARVLVKSEPHASERSRREKA